MSESLVAEQLKKQLAAITCVWCGEGFPLEDTDYHRVAGILAICTNKADEILALLAKQEAPTERRMTPQEKLQIVMSMCICGNPAEYCDRCSPHHICTNYTADNEVNPRRMSFANGRQVWIGKDGFLHTSIEANSEIPVDLQEKAIREFRLPVDGVETTAFVDGSETVSWKCMARHSNMGANDPQECNWPICGCDPHADRVIEALQESGILPEAKQEATPPAQPMKALTEALNDPRYKEESTKIAREIGEQANRDVASYRSAAPVTQPEPPAQEFGQCEKCQKDTPVEHIFAVFTGFAGESEYLCKNCIRDDYEQMEKEIETLKDKLAASASHVEAGPPTPYQQFANELRNYKLTDTQIPESDVKPVASASVEAGPELSATEMRERCSQIADRQARLVEAVPGHCNCNTVVAGMIRALSTRRG